MQCSDLEFLQFTEKSLYTEKSVNENKPKLLYSAVFIFKITAFLWSMNQDHPILNEFLQGIQLLETCRVRDKVEEQKMNEALLLLYMNASLCSLKLGQGARAKKYGRKVGCLGQYSELKITRRGRR